MQQVPVPAGFVAQRGLSLVEVLVASLLLLIVLLGVLPLFTRSIISNVQGQDATTAANFARTELEVLYRLPFDAPELTVPAGQAERLTAWCWRPTPPDELGPGEWIELADVAEACGTDATWRRTVTVRQYSAAAQLLDPEEAGRLGPAAAVAFDPVEALEGDADPTQVHLKELQIELVSLKGGGLLGPPQRVTYRLLKPF